MRTSIRCLSLVAVIAVTIFAVKLLVAFKPPPKKEQGAQVPHVQTAIVAAKTLKPTTQATGRLESLRSQFIFSIPGVITTVKLDWKSTWSTLQEKRGNRGMDAKVEAGRMRIRPIVLTTITTFLGISPLIFFATGQTTFHTPMAVSLGFGLLFTTGPIPVDTKFIYDRR